MKNSQLISLFVIVLVNERNTNTVLPIYRGHFFNFFTNAFVFFCRMGTVGDVKLKVCIHVDKSFLIVCV